MLAVSRGTQSLAVSRLLVKGRQAAATACRPLHLYHAFIMRAVAADLLELEAYWRVVESRHLRCSLAACKAAASR